MDKIADSIQSFINEILGLGDPSKSLAEVLLPQLIVTILMFVVVRFVLWSSVTNLLDKRKKYVEDQIKESEEANNNAKLLLTQSEEELENTRAKVSELIDSAKKTALKTANQLLEQNKKEIEDNRTKAKNQLSQEVLKAEETIKQEIKDVAILMAEKIIEKEIDKDKHEELLNKTLEEVGV